METNELIQRITANSVPVRPLPAPWIRVALWLAISVPYVAAIVLVNPMRAGFAQAMSDQQFLIEQGAILATVLAAAVAAFCSTIPGCNRKILFLPLVPLAIWLASLGEGCVRDWVELGADGLLLRPDWGCLPSAALIGVIPAIAMVFMLRKGAPLFPRVLTRHGEIAVVPDIDGLRFQAVHSLDVGEAYRLAIVDDARGAFNIAADPILDPDTLAQAFGARKLPLPARLVRGGMAASWQLRLQPTPPGWLDMGLSVPIMDTTRAREVLGWKPRHSSVDAIRDVLTGIADAAGEPTPPLESARR